MQTPESSQGSSSMSGKRDFCFTSGDFSCYDAHLHSAFFRGHGMDYYDTSIGIAQPSGEGIADIYTALRLHDSCIGRGFFKQGVCSGDGNACKTCNGVRDIDYLKRVNNSPTTFTWANANCGGSVHCLGYVYSEAVWSLYARELKQSPYGYDDNTALEIVTRLTYIAAGNVQVSTICTFDQKHLPLLTSMINYSDLVFWQPSVGRMWSKLWLPVFSCC